MRNILMTLMIATVSAQLTQACASLSGNRSTGKQSDKSFTVVQQTNGNEVMTQIDRETWVQLRKAANSQEVKLYATLGAKEWEVAASDARAYLSANPKNKTALTVLATSLAMQKNYALAAYYGSLLNRYYPGFSEAKNLMGLATLNRPNASYSDYTKAANYFAQAFDGSDTQIASGLNLGHLYLQLGNAQSAVDVFGAVRQRCNDCTESLVGFAVASSRTRDFKAAKDAFSKVLEKDTNHPGALYYLALIENYGQKRPDRAITLLSKIIKDTSQRDMDTKRKANALLRRLQANDYAKQEKNKNYLPKAEQLDALVPVSVQP